MSNRSRSSSLSARSNTATGLPFFVTTTGPFLAAFTYSGKSVATSFSDANFIIPLPLPPNNRRLRRPPPRPAAEIACSRAQQDKPGEEPRGADQNERQRGGISCQGIAEDADPDEAKSPGDH